MNIWLDYLRRTANGNREVPLPRAEPNIRGWLAAVKYAEPDRVAKLVEAMIASLDGEGYSAQAEELRELVNEFSAAVARVEEVRKQMMLVFGEKGAP